MEQDVIARYKQLKEKKKELEARQVSLSTSLSHYKKEYDEGIEKLKSEYKVSSLKEAYSLLESIESDLNTAMSLFEAKLSQYESAIGSK